MKFSASDFKFMVDQEFDKIDKKQSVHCHYNLQAKRLECETVCQGKKAEDQAFCSLIQQAVSLVFWDSIEDSPALQPVMPQVKQGNAFDLPIKLTESKYFRTKTYKILSDNLHLDIK